MVEESNSKMIGKHYVAQFLVENILIYEVESWPSNAIGSR
jgi:hypothetical protein